MTGVGGAPGFDLARNLSCLGCEVIGIDASPLACGLRLPDLIPRTLPPATDITYIRELLKLCHDLHPDALIPTVEAELPYVVASRTQLRGFGVRTWLPDPPAIEACNDKARFFAVLTNFGIPTPCTWLPHQIDDVPAGLPLIVKPRFGHGSQHVLPCDTVEQARTLCQFVPEPIVQERLDGREFTADCLVDRFGQASVIPRYRLQVKNGLSMVAETFHSETAIELVSSTLQAVGMTGICCAQGFLTNDGTLMMTEINARIAGAFPVSQAAGARLVEQALNGLFGLHVEHDLLTYKPGIRLTKYVETLTTSQGDLP